MRILKIKNSAVYLAILLAVLLLVFLSADERYVAAPGFACVIMMLWLWMTLWDRDKNIPFFDVGVFCALATFVYTVYPLVNYWADGLRFGLLSDSRLQSSSISPFELGFFHLRHVLYLFSFVAIYLLFRGSGAIKVGNVALPNRFTRQVILLFFLILTGYFLLLGSFTGFHGSRDNPDTYGNKVASAFNIASNMPLLLSQISNKLSGILFVFKLALLFIVVSRCCKKKWLIILLLWISAEIFLTVYSKGTRTGLVLFLMATALLYHRMIKPLTMKFLFTLGALLLAGFIFLGVYRSYSSVAEMRSQLFLANTSVLSAGNEFTALLGTAYDVHQRKEGGAYLPWYLYINDFITILPPQQIMPFEKVPASEWYLREIGISGTGQGFMWGVISQSLVGLDWLELAFRGALLGYILACLHRWYLKHQSGFFATLVYMFFCLKVYYTFRSTTFSLLENFVWEIVPFYLLLSIAGAILPRKLTIASEVS
jgi:hypothetical protein